MVEFQAIINKISTTMDGGWRVTLDVAESDREQMLELSRLRQENLYVKVTSETEAMSNG